MIGERELWVKPSEYTFDKVNGYNHTKVLELTINRGDEQLPIPSQPTTWASLLRTTVRTLQDYIDAEVQADEQKFRENFNQALQRTLLVNQLKSNTSFSEELFKEPEHIRSSVYRNNKNSVCKIYNIPDSTISMYITAVYAGEVVWVLNALTTALSDFDISIVVRYINRADLVNLMQDDEGCVDENIREVCNIDDNGIIVNDIEWKIDGVIEGLDGIDIDLLNVLSNKKDIDILSLDLKIRNEVNNLLDIKNHIRYLQQLQSSIMQGIKQLGIELGN